MPYIPSEDHLVNLILAHRKQFPERMPHYDRPGSKLGNFQPVRCLQQLIAGNNDGVILNEDGRSFW